LALLQGLLLQLATAGLNLFAPFSLFGRPLTGRLLGLALSLGLGLGGLFGRQAVASFVNLGYPFDDVVVDGAGMAFDRAFEITEFRRLADFLSQVGGFDGDAEPLAKLLGEVIDPHGLRSFVAPESSLLRGEMTHSNSIKRYRAG